MRLILSILLLTAALPAGAQIYKYTDANGETVFTNQPPSAKDAQPVQLQPTNTVSPQPQTSSSESSPADNPTPASAANYTVLGLSNLPSDQALRANNGTFEVTVTISPPLAANHHLQLLLDGQPYGATIQNPQLPITLENLDRGEHSLAVQVMQGSRVIQSSTPVKFTLQRISTNSPARQRITPRTGN